MTTDSGVVRVERARTRSAGEFWPVPVGILVAVVLIGLAAEPFFYIAIARLTTPGQFILSRAFELHVLANCAVNAWVTVLAWGLKGRLDRRLVSLLNLILG